MTLRCHKSKKLAAMHDVACCGEPERMANLQKKVVSYSGAPEAFLELPQRFALVETK